MITVFKPKDYNIIPKVNFCSFGFDQPTVNTLYNVYPSIPTPIINKASLLSSEELNQFEDYIKDPLHTESECWYLRTPAEDNCICIACFNEGDYDCLPYDIITTSFDTKGIGLRPILKFECPSDYPITLSQGDVVLLAGYYFTVISKDIMLCETMLDNENGVFPVFDPITNIYEKSKAKQSVDDWFNDQIIPFI